MTDIRRIDMRKIRDVLRLHLKGGLSQRQIAAALGISKGVVAKYISLASELGLSWDDISQLSETALERRLIPPTPPPEYFVRPDFGQLHHEMRRKGMTIMLLWQEFMEHHPGERVHQYSQFSVNYRHYVQSLKRSLRMVHRAGEKLFIDYAGPTIKLTDGTKAHIYVAALGASSYTFAYATPRETMADWLWATAKALDFFGGVPQLIVPDNPKAMISQPDRYEPKLSATVQDFARHYGCSILPARPKRPQDKAKVESAVQVVERWIMMRLRHQRFETVDEVNAAIEPLLEYLNTRPFQKLPGSRSTAFAQLDAPALQPLPAQSWELAVFKSVRVHIDQHVEFEGHRYSVPTALVGQVLELRVTAKVVEVLHRGARVTSHMRCAHKGGYSTQVEHLSVAHRKHLEWTPQRLVHWAQSIGSATGALVERLLASHRHPEHGYRSCLGLLSLARRFSEARLEAACEVALSLGTCRYQHVKDILQNGRDKAGAPVADKWQSPEHAHVRGAKYYQ